MQRLLLAEIQQRLQDSPVSLVEGELIFTDTITDREVEDGCTNTTILRLTTELKLAQQSNIALTLDSLFDPVSISVNLAANIDARGRARQNFGIRLGSCVELGSDSFDFTAIGPLTLNLQLTLQLNPVWLESSTLALTPEITVTGELSESRVTVNVDDSLLRNVLEDFLQGQINDLLSPQAVAEEIESLQQRIQQQLQESLAQQDTNGSFVFELPAEDDTQITALYALLTPLARFPLTASFLQTFRLPLLAALITGDDQTLAGLLSNAAECELGGILRVPLPRIPLYSPHSGACAEVTEPPAEGSYSADAACQTSFEFTPTAMAQFCEIALDQNRLGNGASDLPEAGQWSFSPGTTFDFGVLSLAESRQPLVNRTTYKSVATGAGECALEMRIYKQNPLAVGLKPLIALHGGSWQRRGSGFLGIEHMATHFTNAGYVVFAPFYRLIGNSDGTPACRNATLDNINADVNDAVNWVADNQQRFGATGQPVLFGQSAGGHLALTVAVNRPEEVAAAVLFYAPTDFSDFAAQVQSGAYDNPQGQRIIEAVTGLPIDSIDQSSALIRANAFPQRVINNPSVPPLFMLHGKADTLLPARQSVRLCNALSGDIEAGPASLSGGDLITTVQCNDRGSELHLLSEAEHTLDLCISTSLCLAGSATSAQLAAGVVERMLKWVEAPASLSGASESGGGGSVGGGVLLWFLLGIISACKGIRTQ